MKTRHGRHSLIMLAGLILLPFTAHALSLGWPVHCKLGENCLIQNYFDHDPGSAMVDYQCGHEVYEDGHEGIDIRVRDGDAMRTGVPVIAAADGTVFRTRDESIDVASNGQHENRDCGNAVILNHADGYQTIYCHMRQGSVRVKPGDRVRAGDTLGLIGMSGFANFPHLHFTLRQNNIPLDPFTGTSQSTACSIRGTALWSTLIPYADTALLSDGVVDRRPDKAAMRDHPVHTPVVPSTAPAIIYWVDIMHVHANDTITLKLTAPDGSVLAEHSETPTENLPYPFRFIGKENAKGWTPGTYHASATVTRNGATVMSSSKEVVVQ